MPSISFENTNTFFSIISDKFAGVIDYYYEKEQEHGGNEIGWAMDRMFDMKPRKVEYIDQWNSIVFQETKELITQNLFDPNLILQLRKKSTLIKEIHDFEVEHEHYHERFERVNGYVYESDYDDDDESLEESSEEESSEGEESFEEKSSGEESSAEKFSEGTAEKKFVGCCFNRCILI